MPSKELKETERRYELWSSLQTVEASFTLDQLKANGIYNGNENVWIDEATTAGRAGAALSVRKIDRTNIFKDGIIFPYDVGISSDNVSAVRPLETVRTLSLPIFVIFPDEKHYSKQTVKLSWVLDHDEKTGQFLILFDEYAHSYSASQSLSAALSALNDEKTIDPESAPTKYWITKLDNEGDYYSSEWLSKFVGPKFNFSPREFIKLRQGTFYTVLCGPNNGGKTLFLKQLKIQIGRGSYMMGAQRFSHVPMFQTQKSDPNFYLTIERQVIQNISNIEFNHENNFIDLQKTILNLNTEKRNLLFQICTDLIGSAFSMRPIRDNDDLSPRYIDMDGQNLSLGSSGTRLLMTMLGICMDENFHTILIDEPELGLSPNVQSRLAALLVDEKRRKQLFPHLRSIIVATHSRLLLDRKNIKNNFFVERRDNTIYVSEIDSFNKFHKLQFNLLGNSLESMFLPSAFLLIEGPTDQKYLDRCVQLRHPDKTILFAQTSVDREGNKGALHRLRQSLGDIFKSPYRSRIFVVLDQQHERGAPNDLIKNGVLEENICIWSKNGIEHYYPPELMSQIFGCSVSDLAKLEITNDELFLNGVRRRKAVLCDEIVRRMDKSTTLPGELESKLMNRLAGAIN